VQVKQSYGNVVWRTSQNKSKNITQSDGTARSVEDETRNAELNGNRNPEWWGDFIQLVKIEKIKFLGILRYKVELRF